MTISDKAYQRALIAGCSTDSVYLWNNCGKFFIKAAQQEEYIMAIKTRCPGAASAILTAANQVSAHNFNLLGSGPYPLGNEIDWHTDFKSGHSWPKQAYSFECHPALYPGGYDIKIPWELSRCQHLVWLGQAYWLTGEDKFVNEFIEQINSWIKQNPVGFGPNWTCTMEVAIRVINWLWAFAFFEASPCITVEFRHHLFRSMLEHGRYILDHLEKNVDFTGNHYLSNIVGLVYLGILLPGFREAKKWREFGLKELEKEMSCQVYPDGGNFEASTSYHRLVSELFLSATLLAQLNNHTFSQSYLDRLEKMLEFVQRITMPDGTVPLFGDQDNGRLHRLKLWDPPEREWIDFRYLLAIGAVLFQRSDFAQTAVGNEEEAIWFYGDKATRFFELSLKTPPVFPKFYGFSDSGIYVMRNGSDAMIIDAGSVGQNGVGGHAHEDTFNYVLQVEGTTWITDPGTYVYTQDFEARHQFRSSSFHNMLQPDGVEQHVSDSHLPFSIQKSGEAQILRWEENEEYLLFQGQFHYPRDATMIYERIIYLDIPTRIWLIQDAILNKTSQCQLRFHLGDGLILEPANTEAYYLIDRKQPSKIRVHCFGAHVEDLKTETGWFSREYGKRLASSVLVWRPPPASHYVTGIGIEDDKFQERLFRSMQQFSKHILD